MNNYSAQIALAAFRAAIEKIIEKEEKDALEEELKHWWEQQDQDEEYEYTGTE